MFDPPADKESREYRAYMLGQKVAGNVASCVVQTAVSGASSGALGGAVGLADAIFKRLGPAKTPLAESKKNIINMAKSWAYFNGALQGATCAINGITQSHGVLNNTAAGYIAGFGISYRDCRKLSTASGAGLGSAAFSLMADVLGRNEVLNSRFPASVNAKYARGVDGVFHPIVTAKSIGGHIKDLDVWSKIPRRHKSQ